MPAEQCGRWTSADTALGLRPLHDLAAGEDA
ncbi:hypothetical protein P3T39_006289 [Kitasatospora sp. GP82]|nr:hypothetical protein [Kitasatospora sp. GP82]